MTTLNLLLNDLFELSKSYTPPASDRTVDHISVSVPEGSSLSTNISTYTFSLIIALPSGQAFVYTLTPSTATAFEQLNIPVDFSVGGATIQILVTGESDTEIGESNKISLLPQHYQVKPDTLTIVENDTYDVSEYDKVIVNVGDIDELNAALEKTLVGSESSSYEPENPINENISQTISDFADIKQAIVDKGVTVETGTPTSDYSDCIDRIPVSTAYADSLKAMVERSANAHVYIPDGTTSVGKNAFGGFTNLTAVTFPDSLTTLNSQAFQMTGLTSVDLNKVTYIGGQVFLNCNRLTSIDFGDNYRTFGGTGIFQNCSALTQVTLPDGFTNTNNATFQGCSSLAAVSLPNTLTKISGYCFYDCSSLVTINIPGSVTQVANNSFTSCSSLTNVTIGTGFNANNLNLSASTLYTADTIVSWLNALADRTGQTAYTLIIGAANIAKLTAEEIAIATNKNWNLA